MGEDNNGEVQEAEQQEDQRATPNDEPMGEDMSNPPMPSSPHPLMSNSKQKDVPSAEEDDTAMKSPSPDPNSYELDDEVSPLKASGTAASSPEPGTALTLTLNTGKQQSTPVSEEAVKTPSPDPNSYELDDEVPPLKVSGTAASSQPQPGPVIAAAPSVPPQPHN